MYDRNAMRQLLQLNKNLHSLVREYRETREYYLKVLRDPSMTNRGRISANSAYKQSGNLVVKRARNVFKNRPNLVPRKNNNRTRGLILQRLGNSWEELPSENVVYVQQPGGNNSVGFKH